MTAPYTAYRRLYLERLKEAFFQRSREKASFTDEEYGLFNSIRQIILEHRDKTDPRNIAGLLYRHEDPCGVVNHVAMTHDENGRPMPYTLLTMAIDLKVYQLLSVFMPYLDQSQKNLLLMTEGTNEESFGCFQPVDLARRLINEGANPHGIVQVDVPQRGNKNLLKLAKNTPFMFFFERHEQDARQNHSAYFKFPYPNKNFPPFAEFYTMPHTPSDQTVLTHKNEDGETLFSLMIKHRCFNQAMALLDFLKENPNMAAFQKALNFAQVEKHFNAHYEQNKRFFHRFYSTNEREFSQKRKIQSYEEKIRGAIQIAEKHVRKNEEKAKLEKRIEMARLREEENRRRRELSKIMTQGNLDFSPKEEKPAPPVHLEQGLLNFEQTENTTTEENRKSALRYASTAVALLVAGSVAAPPTPAPSKETPEKNAYHSVNKSTEQKLIQQLLPGFERD